MSEFFNMGGYAVYVWPSYGLTAIVLWFNWYLPHRQHALVLSRLSRRTAAATSPTDITK